MRVSQKIFWFEIAVLLALIVGLLFWLMVWVEQANAQDEDIPPIFDMEKFAVYSVEQPRCGYVGGDDLYCGLLLIYRNGLHREWWWAI